MTIDDHGQMRGITMYGADWCGDCRRAKAVFEAAGVDYDHVDLEAEPERASEAVQLSGGRKRIPVIVFGDGTVLVEPADAELEAKLGDLASTYSAVENVEAGRFELWRGDALISIATTVARGEVVTVPHVETAYAHRGAGNADRLMDALLGQLRATGRRIDPVCPFAVDYLRAHPAEHDLWAR